MCSSDLPTIILGTSCTSALAAANGGAGGNAQFNSTGFAPVYPVVREAPQQATGSLYNAGVGETFLGRGRNFQVGDVITVEFTVMGIPCLGLNGGPAFTHDEAFSFQVATDDQEETDRLWNAIVGNGGTARAADRKSTRLNSSH